jgi:hypothetical protein
MGWWAAAAQVVRDVLTPPRPITLDLSPERVFDSPARPVDQVLAALRNGDSGPVSRELALSVAAVQRGRNEICSIATLPLRLYQGLNIVDSPLFRQFDPDVPNVVHMAATLEDLAFESIAWWQITGQDFNGYPMSVRRIDPRTVSLRPPGDAKKNTTPGGLDRVEDERWVWIDSGDGRGPQRFPAALMIRFDSPNPGVLTANGRTIRRAIAIDRVAEMYANNPQLREYFTDNEDSSDDAMRDEEADQFIAEYLAMRRINPVAWIPGNVKRADISSPSPRDLTLVDLQRQVTLEIANGIGVDPEDLGVSTTSRTYFNSVDKKQDKINRTYAPFMKAVTDRLSMGDVTMRGYAAQFDLTDYLKSDPNTQATYWAAMAALGVVDDEWIAGQAGVPMSVVKRVRAAKAAAAPAPAAAAPLAAAATAGRRFDDRPAAFVFDRADFATDTPPATVDPTARTITGLAVPYNATAQKYGANIQFAPGSLEYGDVGQLIHMQDHVTPVGFHRSVTDSKAGPVVELSVLGGPEGSPVKLARDQLLYDAENGLYTGLSVGVDFDMDPDSGDVSYDADSNTYTVLRATWRETSSTPLPAFNDARVTTVAASMTGGTHVDPCQHCGHRHATNIACATFAAQMAAQPAAPTAPAAAPAAPAFDYAAMAAAMHASQQPAAPAAIAAGPSPVSPHRGPATVEEPLPYRYDRKGNLRAGTHDFSGDIQIAYNPQYQGDGSREAADGRVKAWLSYAFGDTPGAPKNVGRLDAPTAAQQFAITPTNVVNLNYPQNHPEMYVDQLDYLYPMYQEWNKGTLDTVTPFVLPKFNASSGLVTDHVTGTEPTPGAFTATSQTITPSALSGKVEITREVFDQGGNPQASGLIWRQMVRGYYEGIEAAIQAFLVANSASIPDIALGIAVTDAAMDQALAAAISALQYIRGGDRYQKVFTQIDLYQKLIKAVDSTNRPLYPTFGAMNASGIANPTQSWLNVRGKTFVPAWATAATGTVAASSWMLDPEVVGIWLSTPQRLDITWRVAWVDLGIFGYKALAITDFTRTRELIYDPV